MFIDRAVITVIGGRGGDGCVAFRREKYIPKGGPNGGNGANGGDVVFVADEGVNTLLDFSGRPEWRAQDGEPGRGSQQAGAQGKDCVIRVPPGTMLIDDETGAVLFDLKPGERAVVAKGGRGGWGNEHFKSSTNQAPRHAEPGAPGQIVRLRLELKLIADAGLIGMPNAGKSTLLASISRATPKIADYPFTTLSPQLGIASLDASRRIVVADIPGLIEGASRGAGLGLDFLRHVERTRVLIHLVEAAPADGSDPAENYRTIRAELSAYSPDLAEKPEVIALSKIDLVPDEREARALERRLRTELKLGKDDLWVISAATRRGLDDLMERAWRALRGTPAERTPGWKEAGRA